MSRGFGSGDTVKKVAVARCWESGCQFRMQPEVLRIHQPDPILGPKFPQAQIDALRYPQRHRGTTAAAPVKTSLRVLSGVGPII
jgi:hypothetical protein